MKYFFCIFFLMSLCHGMDNEYELVQDDDHETLQRNNHPELEYFRMLEKLKSLNKRLRYLQKHCPEQETQLSSIEDKVDAIWAKLNVHENNY